MTFRLVEKVPYPGLVEYLEDLLVRAKDGKIRGMMAVLLWDNEMTTHGWAVEHLWKMPAMLGESHILMTDAANRANADRDYTDTK